MDELIAFLLGEAPLDGVWFGERAEHYGQYWWRTKLREAWNRRAMPAIPAGYALPSRVADLLHLLEFAEITTPSTGDGEQAQKAMADIRAMLEAAPQPVAAIEELTGTP